VEDRLSDSQNVARMARITRRTDARPVCLAVYDQLDALLRTLGVKDWAAPTACPGWSVADMVGHLIGAARGNASVREFTRQQLWGMRHRGEFGGNPLDAVNGLQIADHAGLPDARRAEALREVAPLAIRGRMRLSAWFGCVSVPLSSGGSAAVGMPRSVNLGRLLDAVYTRDAWMHTIDIAEAVSRPPSLSAPVNGRIVQDVVLDWVRRHRQPVDLTLTGPAGGRYRHGAGGTVLEMDAVEFCRILSGRSPGDGLLKTKVLF
jgi:uncharacterized protein (TIGR03083 family)